MSEYTPETREALSPQLRAISDTLDEWLMRKHGSISSWQSPDWFLRWLEERGWTVVEKAHIEALEKELADVRDAIDGRTHLRDAALAASGPPRPSRRVER